MNQLIDVDALKTLKKQFQKGIKQIDRMLKLAHFDFDLNGSTPTRHKRSNRLAKRRVMSIATKRKISRAMKTRWSGKKQTEKQATK